MVSAYYEASIPNFLIEAPESILGKLAMGHRYELEQSQKTAWLAPLVLLKIRLCVRNYSQKFDSKTWNHVYLSSA